MTIRLLLVDDHVLVREALARMLAGEHDLEVVAQASDGEAALALVRAARPDVAVVDIAIPKMTGIELARRIREGSYDTRVVFLSMFETPRHLRDALEVGASGYVLKRSAVDDLFDAVRMAAAGGIYLSPALAPESLAAWRAGAPSDLRRLTVREREVVRLVCEGLTSKQIAARAGVGFRTVDAQRRSAMHKLDLRSLPDLVKWAVRHHLASLDR